jgi:hypothetical protein
MTVKIVILPVQPVQSKAEGAKRREQNEGSKTLHCVQSDIKHVLAGFHTVCRPLFIEVIRYLVTQPLFVAQADGNREGAWR